MSNQHSHQHRRRRAHDGSQATSAHPRAGGGNTAAKVYARVAANANASPSAPIDPAEVDARLVRLAEAQAELDALLDGSVTGSIVGRPGAETIEDDATPEARDAAIAERAQEIDALLGEAPAGDTAALVGKAEHRAASGESRAAVDELLAPAPAPAAPAPASTAATAATATAATATAAAKPSWSSLWREAKDAAPLLSAWEGLIGVTADRPKAEGPARATAHEASHQASAAAAPLPHAGAARHDGGDGHKLGDGDEVFDEHNEIVQAFPTSPDGVVQAAFYELHRGDAQGLGEIMADTSHAKTARGAQAGTGGGGKYGAYTDDLDQAQAIGHQTKYTEKHHAELVMSGNAIGPIQAYQMAGHFSPYLKRLGSGDAKNERKMWCGSFVTFVYARCGIRERSFAMARDGAVIDAAFGGQYFDAAGGEYGVGQVLDDPSLKKAKLDQVRGQMSHTRGRLTSLATVDVRPGDHFHTGKHTGLIVGVHKTATKIDLVTIEGNVNDKVESRHREILLNPDGTIDTQNVKEWSRPPQFAASPAVPLAGGDEPAWLQAGKHREPKRERSAHAPKPARSDDHPDANWE